MHQSLGDETAGQLLQAVERRDLLRGVERLLVACSGGGDSVALLVLLHDVAPQLGIRLAVGHVDHGVRGAEARRDADHVAMLAASFGVEMLETGPVPSPQAPSEATLRAARFQALGALASRCGADAIALGHTLEDRAETLLLNAARGAGRTGLAALRWRREVAGLLLVRPLLGIRRDALRRHLRGRGIGWMEDSTNESLDPVRNRIRRLVLPPLEAAVPGAVESLARLADVAGREEQWLEAMVAERLAALARPGATPGSLALELGALRAAHPALQARLVRLALARVRGGLAGVARSHIEAVLEIVGGPATARDLPGVRVRREGGSVLLLPLENRRLAAVTGTSSRDHKS